MNALLRSLVVSLTIWLPAVAYTQERPTKTVKVAFGPSIVLDDSVKPITESFCERLGEELGNVRVECVYPTARLGAVGAQLVEGNEFQLAVVWGIEYGWLLRQKELNQLEVLVVAKGKFEGDVGANSNLLVRKDLLDNVSPEDLLGTFNKGRPFRLARHKWESLVTDLHLVDLIKKYGSQAFEQPPRPFSNGIEALFEIGKGNYDGMLIDEYRFILMDRDRPLKKKFRLLGDWGIRDSPLRVPLIALVGVPEKVETRAGKSWKAIQKDIVRFANSGDPDAKDFLLTWQSSALLLPSKEFKSNSLAVATQYKEEELDPVKN